MPGVTLPPIVPIAEVRRRLAADPTRRELALATYRRFEDARLALRALARDLGVPWDALAGALIVEDAAGWGGVPVSGRVLSPIPLPESRGGLGRPTPHTRST